MTIKTLENQAHLDGTVMFLNAAIKTYLNRPTNQKRTDGPFVDLKTMMAQNLYISELRCADKEGEEYNQVDLIGFKSGEAICFTLYTNSRLTVVDFKEANWSQMSDSTQKLAISLKEESEESVKTPDANL
ncbi:hypothetical protein [Legionella drozanskii]|uniref:Uncharacterized protein n=1 Tax=Legionella drozanskii LLAP-1 TaxID=1212489 RepID=A0A0W0SXG5_9GAMM|nr:hypothetical protein [Legionella drozanskii]KTC88017.1 hypothetical protein Ldro_1636 [Legionella drozanskii LLAP-1]